MSNVGNAIVIYLSQKYDYNYCKKQKKKKNRFGLSWVQIACKLIRSHCWIVWLLDRSQTAVTLLNIAVMTVHSILWMALHRSPFGCPHCHYCHHHREPYDTATDSSSALCRSIRRAWPLADPRPCEWVRSRGIRALSSVCQQPDVTAAVIAGHRHYLLHTITADAYHSLLNTGMSH